jgi:outer membrane protein
MAPLALLALLAPLPLLVTAGPALAQGAPKSDTLTRPLSLGEAARLAARQSALAETGRLRTEQAEARARERRADLLPNLSSVATDGKRSFNTATFGFDFPGFDPNGTVIGPVRTVDVRGRVAQDLVDVAALNRYRSARTSVRASDADASDAAERAASAAAAAYLRALRAGAQLQARAADSALASDLLGIAQQQLQAGVGVGLDVTRAQAQAATVQAQLIVARNEKDRSELDLLRSLNLPLTATVTLADSLPVSCPLVATAQVVTNQSAQGGPADCLAVGDTVPDEAAAVERALRTRPDLRAADEQLRAAEQQLSAIRAERLPSLSAFADQGAIGKDYGNLKNTYTWGVQVSLPIFDGLRREARGQEQQALARELDVRRRDLRQQAEVDVRGALLDLASARQQVTAARERLRLGEQELSQARDRFRAGVAGNADVISASLALNSSRNLLIDALTAYQSARVNLARAQGTVTELP